MFSSYKDDPPCFNNQPLLESRGQPPFLAGNSSKQTSGPPWDYSQQTFSTVPFYSGDQNLNHRHPGIQNPSTVPHMENSSVLSSYNKNIISGGNCHQSVVRPRAVINCQANCEACYSHSFTRFPHSWSAASSESIRYGGGSSVASLPTNDIQRFPANFPQTNDCSNRFGEDFPSSLKKLSRYSKDVHGITASIPKKNISPVTDSDMLTQQNHSRAMGISEQYASSLTVDDTVAKTEVCHITCRGMCGQSNCKLYKPSSIKCTNLNSVPVQQYGMPRENVVRYTGHAAALTGSQWHAENHQPSRLWLPKGHPPGIWIPPQEPVNSFEHSSASSFWGERNASDITRQQFPSQNYEISSNFRSANEIKMVQSIAYKEGMGGIHQDRSDKIHERNLLHQNSADISRYSTDVMKRRQENLTSEHAARYMQETSQRNQQKCDNTGNLLSQDLHYQKLSARNAHSSSKPYPEVEINKDQCRNATASTDMLLQINSNETMQNYTPPLDPHSDVSRKYSFSAPVGSYQNHSPVLGIAQPPSRFGSQVTYSRISRNNNSIFPEPYIEGSRPLSCQLPSDNDVFLNQNMTYDPNKEYADNVIHCQVQNPDSISRSSSVKETSQIALGFQSCNKTTDPNVTGYFGASSSIHEVDSNSKSNHINSSGYHRDSVVTNCFQDNALYQSSSNALTQNAFINEMNYSSKRYTNVPVISRTDKDTCQLSTSYDTCYNHNSPLASEGSPDRPIKKRKSRVRTMDNAEKRMDNGRNNHVLDVRQFLETWDEEMDLSPAPRLPDIVLSSNSVENPLLVLDCRQLGTNGVATLSAVDRSTGNVIQTYQRPIESPSENKEASKQREHQFGECANSLPLNPLEEISRLCNANENSDPKINKQDAPDSEIAPQGMQLSNSATEFSLNSEENVVDTCNVSDGVIQELLLPNQKFQNPKIDEKTDVSDFDALCDCGLNTNNSHSSSHITLQVAQNESAHIRRDCKNVDHISDSYSSSHLQEGINLLGACCTDSNSEVHLKLEYRPRIQTLKELCEYVLKQQVANEKSCKPLSSKSDANPPKTVGTFNSVASIQDAGIVHHKQTVKPFCFQNDTTNNKEAYSEKNNVIDDNKVYLNNDSQKKQICLLDDKAETTEKILEDKSFKQSVEEKYEEELNDNLKLNNIVTKEDGVTSLMPYKIIAVSGKKQGSQNSSKSMKGDKLLSGGGELNIVTDKESEFKATFNKNVPNGLCFDSDSIEAMDFTRSAFKEESEAHKVLNTKNKPDNCESTLISAMRSNIPSVLANSDSETDDRYDLDMSVTSSIHSDIDIEQSEPLKTHSVEITYDESNEFFDSDVMEGDELMCSNMAKASEEIICSPSTFEASYCKADETKECERDEIQTNHYKDFSPLVESLMQQKLELQMCSNQTSETILSDKQHGRKLVEKSIRNTEELLTEKGNVSEVQQLDFESFVENLNVNKNNATDTLKHKFSASNKANAMSTQIEDIVKCTMNTESVKELQLDENRNQSSFTKLVLLRNMYDKGNILQKSNISIVNSIENVDVHLEYPEEPAIVTNGCNLPSTELSSLTDISIKECKTSQKTDEPTFEPLETVHVDLECQEEPMTVTNEGITIAMHKPKTKACSELVNLSDGSAELVTDPLLITVADCDLTSTLITKSKLSELSYPSATCMKEDELLQKSEKLSFTALENVNNLEYSDESTITATDCHLPCTIVTKAEVKTKENSNMSNDTDNELAINDDSQERKGNSDVITAGCSSLAAVNANEIEDGSSLQKNGLNIECKQNTANSNTPDLLHNVLLESNDESKQEDTDNINKMLKDEKECTGIVKNIANHVLKAVVCAPKTDKLILDVFPHIPANLHQTTISTLTDSENNGKTSLLVYKNSNHNNCKSKSKYLEKICEEKHQQLDNCPSLQNNIESNNEIQNTALETYKYCPNSNADVLEVSSCCQINSVTNRHNDTKHSEGCLCFSSLHTEEKRNVKKKKFTCAEVCILGNKHTGGTSMNEEIVKNMLNSALQQFSNFVFADKKYHAESLTKRNGEKRKEDRIIARNENAFIGKLENVNANVGIRKFVHSPKLFSKFGINLGSSQYRALLETTTSLKHSSMKANNLNNKIAKRGGMTLKSTYFFQRRFSEPLIENYRSDIHNQIRLRTCVSVMDLNSAHVSDTLTEVLRKNQLEIIVKLKRTYCTRSRITDGVTSEAHTEHPHFLNEEGSRYRCVEYLDPAGKNSTPKPKKALKRKISQYASDDEVYHSFSKTLNITVKKRNIKEHDFDLQNSIPHNLKELSSIELEPETGSDGIGIDKKSIKKKSLRKNNKSYSSILNSNSSNNNTFIELYRSVASNYTNFQLPQPLKYDCKVGTLKQETNASISVQQEVEDKGTLEVEAEDSVTQICLKKTYSLHTDICEAAISNDVHSEIPHQSVDIQTNISSLVESNSKICANHEVDRCSTLTVPLDKNKAPENIGNIADNYQPKSNNKVVQKCVPDSKDNNVIIIKENDDRGQKQNSCIEEKFQDDGTIEKINDVTAKIQDDATEKIPCDDLVEKIENDLTGKVEDENVIEKIPDDGYNNDIGNYVTGSEVQQIQKIEENDLFETAHTTVNSSHSLRNYRHSIPEELNVSMTVQDVDNKMKISQKAEKDVEMPQMQEMVIKRMPIEKSIEVKDKEAVVSNTNEMLLLPSIQHVSDSARVVVDNNIVKYNIRNVLQCDVHVDSTNEEDKINKVPCNVLAFRCLEINVHKQTKNSKSKQEKEVADNEILCESIECRNKALEEPLVNDNHIKVLNDASDKLIQEIIHDKESDSEMERCSIRCNATGGPDILMVTSKNNNCINLESHVFMNEALAVAPGQKECSIVEKTKTDTRENRLVLQNVVRDNNLLIRNVNSEVKEPQNYSEMQKREKSKLEKLETTPVLKVSTHTLIPMQEGSTANKEVVNERYVVEEELSLNNKPTGIFSGALSPAPEERILTKYNCNYNLEDTTGCTNGLLVLSAIQHFENLREIRKDTSNNMEEAKDKTKLPDSKQETKHKNDADFSVTKELKIGNFSQQFVDLAANVTDKVREIEDNCIKQNKIMSSSSLRRLMPADNAKKDTGNIHYNSDTISLRSDNIPDLLDIVKKSKIIEEWVDESNHDVDAYVDMPCLEAISTEVSSNDSETEMPCLELIDDIEPKDVNHIQELAEIPKNGKSSEYCAEEEIMEEVKQEKLSVDEKVSVSANKESSSDFKISAEVQCTQEDVDNTEQKNLKEASEERSSLYILKDKSDSVCVAQEVSEAEVQKAVLPVGNHNESDTDGWVGLGFTESYSLESNTGERVNKEMNFCDKEKSCDETELARAFPICTESDCIPLQMLEADTEYMRCMNNESNGKECWTSEKFYGDNRYIAEEEACDFNASSQVCSDVLMSNCEPERLELDIPSVIDSVPSHLETPEIGSSLGDVIQADFVTNWPYLEEEVLCEVDTLCSADMECHAVSSNSPVEECLARDLSDTVKTSALDSDPCSGHDDPASLGEFKCRLSWKKIFNFSKSYRKQHKKYKKLEKEDNDESIVTSVSSTCSDTTNIQNENIENNCVPINSQANTSALTSNNKEVDGLELGPAKIEVRIPRSANSKGFPKVWKVVDRSKSVKSAEAQKANGEANNGNTDDISQVPIVVVKRLILKRGYDDEEADKAKRRKHSHKKTLKNLPGKSTDLHELINNVNGQVKDFIHKSTDIESPNAEEFSVKPTEYRMDGSNTMINDIKDTENNSHCSDSVGESCTKIMLCISEDILTRDILNQDSGIEENGTASGKGHDNSSVSSSSEKILDNTNTDISECTEQQKVSQKIPKVIIKRTVGIDNTNNYRSFLTDDVLSNNSRSCWNPVVRLERNASLDRLARKLVSQERSTEEAFAQNQVRHGIKINLRSPPGTPAVTIVPLSSAVPVNTENINHSHKRRKHFNAKKRSSSATEDQKSSVTSSLVNNSANNHAHLSLSCSSDGSENHQESINNRIVLNQDETRVTLDNKNNLEDYILVENKHCTTKDITKITFHRHKKKKKKRKTEFNRRKNNNCLNSGHTLTSNIEQIFLESKNGVQNQSENALDSSAVGVGKNPESSHICFPSVDVNAEVSASQSTNEHHHTCELSHLLLTSPDIALENQRQSITNSYKTKKRQLDEEYVTDELPLFHPDRILTYSCSSRKKKLKSKEKSQALNEQELEKEIKDICLEMASSSRTSVTDVPEHDKVITKVCNGSASNVTDLRFHNCPEMMCCQVSGHLYEQQEERISYVKHLPFHCQRCHLAFKSENDFINHLAEQHPRTRAKHHCLLCERTFPSAERHKLHLAGRTHRHLELTQRRTIHAIFSLFTGHSCPVLEPLTDSELAGLNWLPVEPGTINFYHQRTPLQQVIQDLVHRKERSVANVSTATTEILSPSMLVEENYAASEDQ